MEGETRRPRYRHLGRVTGVQARLSGAPVNLDGFSVMTGLGELLSWYCRKYRYSKGPISILVFKGGRWKKLKDDAAGVGRGRDDIESVTQFRPGKAYGVRTCWSIHPYVPPTGTRVG